VLVVRLNSIEWTVYRLNCSVSKGKGRLHDFGNFILDLHVFKGILLSYASQNVLFAAFLELAREEQLIENIVCLGEGENYVQLANIAIVFVHLFNITVDNFEGNEFVIV